MPLEREDLDAFAPSTTEGHKEWPGVRMPKPGPPPLPTLEREDVEAFSPETDILDMAKPPILSHLDDQNYEHPTFMTRMTGKVVDHVLGRDVDDTLPWTRIGTGLVGAIGGAVIGAQVPGPPLAKGAGAAVGGAGGAFVGAVAPELSLEILEAFKVVPPGTRDRLGLDQDQLRTYAENEILTEIALGGALTAARLMGRGAVKLSTGMTKEGKRLAGVASREGVALLPVMIGDGKFPRFVVSVLGRFPVAAGGLRKRGEAAMKGIDKMLEGIPARFGPLSTYDEASGDMLREATETAKWWNDTFEEAWSEALAGANRRGLYVMPVTTRRHADEILEHIGKDTPKGLKGEILPVEKDTQFVREFIKKNISPLYDELNIVGPPTYGKGIPHAEQRTFSMKQADTLAGVIQEGIATLSKMNASPANIVRMERLLNGLQMDMLEKVIQSPAVKHKGPMLPGSRFGGYSLDDAGDLPYPPVSDAQWYAVNMRLQEDEQTRQIAWFFDNAASKKMGISISARKTSVNIKTPTSSPDAIARALLKSGNPKVVDELATLTGRRGPEPMQKLARAVFDEAMSKAKTHKGEGVTNIDVDVFAKELGLDDVGSAKYLTTEKLMQHSGGMEMSQLRDFVEIARRASRAEIPNVATFIARRGLMGGIRGIVNAVMPWMAVTGAGAVAGGGAGGAMVGGVLLFGGTRLYTQMLSNPRSARALREVADVSVKAGVRRLAMVRAWTSAANELVGTGEMTKEEFTEKTKQYGIYLQEVDRADRINSQRND